MSHLDLQDVGLVCDQRARIVGDHCHVIVVLNLADGLVLRIVRAGQHEFRDWFLEFEADAWDRQIERDANAGKLDSLARKALEDHAAGRTTPL